MKTPMGGVCSFDLMQSSFTSKSAYRFSALGKNKFIKLGTERFDEADVSGVGITIHVRCKLLESIHKLRSDPQECRQLLFVIQAETLIDYELDPLTGT
jgi:hypothetical protein